MKKYFLSIILSTVLFPKFVSANTLEEIVCRQNPQAQNCPYYPPRQQEPKPSPSAAQFIVVAKECRATPMPEHYSGIHFTLSAVDTAGRSVDAFAYSNLRDDGFIATNFASKGDPIEQASVMEACEVYRKSISVDTRHLLISGCFKADLWTKSVRMAFVGFRNGKITRYSANGDTCELYREREKRFNDAIDASSVN